MLLNHGADINAVHSRALAVLCWSTPDGGESPAGAPRRYVGNDDGAYCSQSRCGRYKYS